MVGALALQSLTYFSFESLSLADCHPPLHKSLCMMRRIGDAVGLRRQRRRAQLSLQHGTSLLLLLLLLLLLQLAMMLCASSQGYAFWEKLTENLFPASPVTLLSLLQCSYTRGVVIFHWLSRRALLACNAGLLKEWRDHALTHSMDSCSQISRETVY